MNKSTGLNNEVKEVLREHKNRKREDKLEELNVQDPGIWTFQKALKTHRKPIRPLHGKNEIVCKPNEKAETFAYFLER